MRTTTIYRYLCYHTAKAIMDLAQRMLNVRLVLNQDDPGEADTKRGVGKWAIQAETSRVLGTYETLKIWDTLEKATLLVLDVAQS